MTIIDDIGETLTIREVTNTIDEYGDATETTADQSVEAAVELVSADEDIVKSGILNVGDAVGYFEPADVAYIKEGNRVQHNSIWYVITTVQSFTIGGTGMHIEAHLKKLTPQ